MRNNKAITIRNSVIKNDRSLLRVASKAIINEGIFAFIERTFRFFLFCLRNFIREYLPLKYIYFSSNGEIIKNIHGNKMILDSKDVGISRELVL